MRQFAWFDCLRCAAIFLVMVAHCGDFSQVLPPIAARLFSDLQLFSWAGVDLFFVLSGFLVSGLLFDEHDRTGTLNIGRFLIRRAFKIIPPFYVLMLFTVIYDTWFHGHVNVTHLVHDIFFLQSYRIGYWSHGWTLAIEVHFYLLLAMLLYWLSRKSSPDGLWLRRLPTIICGVLLACFVARLINSELRPGNFNMHREFQPSHLHLDVLAAGVLLRYLYNYHFERLAFLTKRKLLWIGLGLLLVYPSEYLWVPHPDVVTALIPVCNYLGFGLILFEATQISFPTAGFLSRLVWPFDYLGKHSYSIYLWHLPVKDWLIDPFVKEKGIVYILLFFGASLVVGTFFSIVLEMPVLALRNRLFPSSSSARPKANSDPGAVPA